MIGHSYSKHSSLYGSGGSRGGPRGTQAPPLFLDQTEARRAEKNIFGDAPSPLSQGLDDQGPPYLKVWIRTVWGTSVEQMPFTSSIILE